MSLWRQCTRGLRSLLRQTNANDDIAAEIRQYLDDVIEAGVACGLSPEDAQRAARAEIGNLTPMQEQVRSYGWENAVRTFFFDLRYAARQLRRKAGFSTVSIITLALGIGACTAIFSAVNPILFSPLPYPHADRLTMIWYANADGSRDQQAFHTYRELTERSRSFETTAVAKPWLPTLTGNDQPERLEGQKVSAAYFRTLAVSPVLGRDFQPSDDVLNGPRVVILSDRLWRRVLGGNPAILGQQVKFDDNLYTVIGIMPRSFENILQPS